MTIHYHGTPITPVKVLLSMRGMHFCVSHAHPDDVERVHKIGQSVLLDNGAFSAKTKGRKVDWLGYYEWADRWLQCPTTWAIIPDVIDGTMPQQIALIKAWPFGHRGAPVWHMNETISHLLRLLDDWPRVCIGSSGAFWKLRSEAWSARMDFVWNEITKRHKRPPWVHMLRGMALSGGPYPFASVDSVDVGRNYRTRGKQAQVMANDWDSMQCRIGWTPKLSVDPFF